MGFPRTMIGRSLLGACVLLGCPGVAVAVASAARAPRAQVRHVICQRALDPPARAFAATAVMRPIKGTAHMQLEFTLEASTLPPGSFAAVPGNGLGTWLAPPDPDLGSRRGDVWVLHHPVANLAAPASYRFRISFRWLGAGGQVLRTVTRLTRICRQPELRPDLAIRSFTAAPVAGRPRIDRYTAVIANQGGGPAREVEVRFTDGAKVATRTLRSLRRGALRTIAFDGPRCDPAAPPTLEIDPDRALDDSDRANNTASASCPATGGATGATGIAGARRMPAAVPRQQQRRGR